MWRLKGFHVSEQHDWRLHKLDQKANAAHFAAMTLPMKDSHPDYPAVGNRKLRAWFWWVVITACGSSPSEGRVA